MMRSVIYHGAALKLNISIQPIDGVTMDEYDFKIEVFTPFSSETASIEKSEMIRIDEKNYRVLIDTKRLGLGSIGVKVIAEIPDGDFPDQTRTEIDVMDLGIDIIE